MGYSNGQLETSSGTGQGERGEPGLPGIGFNLTDDGSFDLNSKRLTDVADPVDDGDAASKKYVLSHISSDAASKKNMLTMKTLDKILPLIVKRRETEYSPLTVLKV